MAGSLANASLSRTPTSRESVLDEMLDHYIDARATLNSRELGNGKSANRAESREFQVSRFWWNESYAELERCLLWLHRHGRLEPLHGVLTRTYYWHLAEWYLRCERVRRPVMRTDKKGRVYQAVVQGQPAWCVEAVRHPDVDAGRVLEALGLIAAIFKGKPELSRAVREIGTKAA